jgi:dTDP-L-rhamnose 4-epimerase
MRVLVTGGAGFIGSHLVRALLGRGDDVRVLDLMVPQVHGADGNGELPAGVERIVGDVSDAGVVAGALDGVEAVFHQAAEVGVGQSMYEIDRYVAANTYGTAVLLRALIDRRDQVRKLVVASSMSIYGEGAYTCGACGNQGRAFVAPMARRPAQLLERQWELICPLCGDGALAPIPTPEDKPLFPTSVYAITKQDQEQLCLTVGGAYGIPTVALRYFNVYGPGQALSNPYTGVCAIFSSRLLNGQPPLIFEDGRQSRDFVHVDDIVQANLAALDLDGTVPTGINIGTGTSTSVVEVARLLAEGLGVDIDAEVVGRYREGDVRHCFADISLARQALGYEPTVTLRDGMPALLEWVRQQTAADRTEQALAELTSRRLVW